MEQTWQSWLNWVHTQAVGEILKILNFKTPLQGPPWAPGEPKNQEFVNFEDYGHVVYQN